MGSPEQGEQEFWDEDLFSRFLERLGPDDLARNKGAPEESPADPQAEEPPPSTRLIERLGERRTVASRYRILEHVASGGMGAIYKVWDEDLRRTLAMKVALVSEPSRPSGSGAAGGAATATPSMASQPLGLEAFSAAAWGRRSCSVAASWPQGVCSGLRL